MVSSSEMEVPSVETSGSTGPIRVAMIGLGFGLSRCDMIENTAETALVAVCSRSKEKAEAAATKFGCSWTTNYQELLDRDDVDVVAVYTPTGAHRDPAIDAAKAGKHIVVSKPVAATLDDSVEVVAACERSGVLIAVEFDTHYSPDAYQVYRAIAEGRLGKLVQGEYVNKCHRDQAYYEAEGSWRNVPPDLGGGAVINQGVHALDQMVWYHGPADGVFAIGGAYAHDIFAEDTASALVRFRDGSLATFNVTTTFHNDRPRSRYGEGTMKRAEINGVDGSVTLVDDRPAMWQVHGAARAGAVLPELPPANVFQDLAWSLRDPGRESPTLVSGAAALDTMRLVAAIYRSIENGGYVRLEDL